MLKKTDPQIFRLIELEEKRQREGLVLIPSENYASLAVREASGSVLTNKYSEGYPGKRYYSGNQFIDQVEKLAQERAKKLFGVPYVNVQPFSGAPANQAVYYALLQPGDAVMGMELSSGGHLTHGSPVNFSGRYYQVATYKVDEKTGLLDYDQAALVAKKVKPKLIWVGFSAYPRIVDWARFGKIAENCGAFLVADIAHYAGLIAAGVYPTPVPWAHILTTTTHKTLRGPRGAMIMVTKKGLEKDPDLPTKIDKAVFPGIQAGPHDQTTAAIAVCLKEASLPSFKKYARQIVKNAQVLAEELAKSGFDLVSGGTDNHLILVDLTNKGVTGKQVQDALEAAGIFVNKNTVPGEKRSPFDPSGIRLGTPAVTTRGMREKEMKLIAGWINAVVEKMGKPQVAEAVRLAVLEFIQKFPVPR